ncbi:penicillin acylase family protein, partial [Zavarzinia sp.]|uniref:penicillin acylase family protein n=1 Tax=Zavarzinia sp. TaxID=2027920 RepID=UPI003BB5098D
ALADALDELTKRFGDDPAAWRWGAAHVAEMRHPILRFLPVVGGMVAITPPVGGGDDTLLRGAMRFSGSGEPYASVHGAGFRAVYDLGDLGRSRFMIATGQSGNPYSPHWSDMAPLWAGDKYVEIPLSPEAIDGDRRGLSPSE